MCSLSSKWDKYLDGTFEITTLVHNLNLCAIPPHLIYLRPLLSAISLSTEPWNIYLLSATSGLVAIKYHHRTLHGCRASLESFRLNDEFHLEVEDGSGAGKIALSMLTAIYTSTK
jgi:hypothetical protein